MNDRDPKVRKSLETKILQRIFERYPRWKRLPRLPKGKREPRCFLLAPLFFFSALIQTGCGAVCENRSCKAQGPLLTSICCEKASSFRGLSLLGCSHYSTQGVLPKQTRLNGFFFAGSLPNKLLSNCPTLTGNQFLLPQDCFSRIHFTEESKEPSAQQLFTGK